MVGLNLRRVGAVAETHLEDTPVSATLPGESADFAGVLEMALPSSLSPSPDEAATPDVPDTDALQAQFAITGLMTLLLPPTTEPTAPSDYSPQTLQPAQTLEPRLHAAGETISLQTEPTLLLEPRPATASLPNFEATFGDGMGDTNSTQPQLDASESLLAMEGDAPPAAARQAELPSPSSFTPMLDAASFPRGAMAGTLTDSGVALLSSPSPSGSPWAPQPEPRATHNEPSVGQHEPRALTATHTATLTQHVTHAGSPTEGASPPHRVAPNWGATEQIVQHIERMVYERERNSITVRLDPPELGVVELRIQVTGSEVQAWLTAERDLTRQMLQQAQQYLREQLESRGLHLTHFDVGTQSQFQHAPREQYTRYAAHTTPTRTPTATDSLLYDGRWSVWV